MYSLQDCVQMFMVQLAIFNLRRDAGFDSEIQLLLEMEI